MNSKKQKLNPRLNKSIIAGLCLVLLYALSSSAAMNESVNLVSRDKNTGAKRWESRVEGRYLTYQGKNFIYFMEAGKEDSDYGQTWISTAYSFIENGEIKPYSINVVIKNHDGDIVNKVVKYYDYQQGKLICIVNGRLKEFAIKDNMIDKQNMALFLMNFPFHSKTEIDGYLVTHDPAVYKVKMVNLGTDVVDGIDCYKIEMIFDLGMLNLFHRFIPKFYFWCEAKYPHNFVQYEGLESGLGTPYVVVRKQNNY